MEKQLTHVKNDISIIKARNNSSWKKTLLREIKEKLLEMQNDIAPIKENKTLSESQHNCTESKCYNSFFKNRRYFVVFL